MADPIKENKEVFSLLDEIKKIDGELVEIPREQAFEKLKERGMLFKALNAKAIEQEFTILPYVEFFNDYKKIDNIIKIVESVGGFLAPHSSGGFSRKHEDNFHIFIPPSAVVKIEKHETIFGGTRSSEYTKNKTVTLKNDFILYFHEALGIASQVETR